VLYGNAIVSDVCGSVKNKILVNRLIIGVFVNVSATAWLWIQTCTVHSCVPLKKVVLPCTHTSFSALQPFQSCQSDSKGAIIETSKVRHVLIRGSFA
jgi:hypothetical protein